VESIVTIVKAVTSVPPAMRPNSEHAVYRAHRTADARADRTSDDGADRTGGTSALARAFLGASDDALRTPEMGDRQQGQSDCRSRQMKLEGKAARQRQRPDLRLHLNSLC
jgi:hypothetical protein